MARPRRDAGDLVYTPTRPDIQIRIGIKKTRATAEPKLRRAAEDIYYGTWTTEWYITVDHFRGPHTHTRTLFYPNPIFRYELVEWWGQKRSYHGMYAAELPHAFCTDTFVTFLRELTTGKVVCHYAKLGYDIPQLKGVPKKWTTRAQQILKAYGEHLEKPDLTPIQELQEIRDLFEKQWKRGHSYDIAPKPKGDENNR